jgi:hypothetical protein
MQMVERLNVGAASPSCSPAHLNLAAEFCRHLV